MRFTLKRQKNEYPKTVYRYSFIEITYINTYQIISLNIIFFNVLFKVLYEKKSK